MHVVGPIHAGNSNVRSCTKPEAIALRDEDEKRPKIVDQANDAWGGSNSQPTGYVRPSRSGHSRQPSITTGFNQVEQQALEDEYALAFCESHLPWLVTDRPAWRTFLHHLNRSKINWQVPGRNKLSGTILTRLEAEWDGKLQRVRAGWASTGVTIACDG